jgi:hypothetical protein
VPKRLVIHGLFRYTDSSTKQLTTAYRGEVINVSGKDLERGEKHGAFGTKADLVPKLDEGVVELPAEVQGGTPVVPHVARASRVDAVLRDRLNLPLDATEADVVAALDAAIAKAQEQKAEEPAQPSTPAPVEPVIVNLPQSTTEGDGTADLGDSGTGSGDDEGQAAEFTGDQGAADAEEEGQGPPPLSAVKARWVAYAVGKGMPEGEANAASKQDLIAKYGEV